jgi:hypothetical protein
MWALAFGHHEGPYADARLRADARGRDGCVREELAAGVASETSGAAYGKGYNEAQCKRGIGDIVDVLEAWEQSQTEIARHDTQETR